MAEGIGHYENIIAEVIVKVRSGQKLSIDDKLDYALACHRVNITKWEVETRPNIRDHYLKEAEKYLRLTRRLERQLGMDI